MHVFKQANKVQLLIILKGLVLKKNITFCLVISLLYCVQFTHANESEVKLSKSCIKNNPLVAGESDPTLLGFYAQACDKKNQDTKNNFLVAAAQRYQQLGQNFKALQLVNDLKVQNVQSTALTDVEFLASLKIAYTALNQIRDKEVRYLTETGTYPAVKEFNDAVKKALPAPVIAHVSNDDEPKSKATFVKNTKHFNNTNVKSNNKRSVTQAEPKPKTTLISNKAKVAPTAPVSKSSGSPFASL